MWYVSAPLASLRSSDASVGSSLFGTVLSSPAAVSCYSAGVLAGCGSYVACRRAACAVSVLLQVSASSPRVVSLPLSALAIYGSGCVAAHTAHCTTHSLSAALSASTSSSKERDALRVLSRYWPFERPGQ